MMVNWNRSMCLGTLVIAALAHSAPASAVCAQLTPSRITTRNVNIASTSLRLAQGMIGVQPATTGPGLFFNLNQGDRTGYIKLIFTGAAPATGIAAVQDSPLHIEANWALTGDYVYQAPNNRPDSSLDVRAFATVALADGAPRTVGLLSVRTYNQGASGQLYFNALQLFTSSFRVVQGQPIEFVVGLAIDSYSSARGTAGMTVSEFAWLENVNYVNVCVTPAPPPPEPID
jgi:hypothetical protein